MTLCAFSPMLVGPTQVRATDDSSDLIPFQHVDDWVALQDLIFPESPDDDEIDSLEDGYLVLRPIPVRYERHAHGTIASFVQANIAISGVDAQDAYQALVAEILDTFDFLTAEPVLSESAAKQLNVLRDYIEQK